MTSLQNDPEQHQRKLNTRKCRWEKRASVTLHLREPFGMSFATFVPDLVCSHTFTNWHSKFAREKGIVNVWLLVFTNTSVCLEMFETQPLPCLPHTRSSTNFPCPPATKT
jgi:hypothetical protein